MISCRLHDWIECEGWWLHSRHWHGRWIHLRQQIQRREFQSKAHKSRYVALYSLCSDASQTINTWLLLSMCSAFENAINSFWSIRGRHRIFQDIVLNDTFDCSVSDGVLLLADGDENSEIDSIKTSETCPEGERRKEKGRRKMIEGERKKEDGRRRKEEGRRNSAFALPTLHISHPSTSNCRTTDHWFLRQIEIKAAIDYDPQLIVQLTDKYQIE